MPTCEAWGSQVGPLHEPCPARVGGIHGPQPGGHLSHHHLLLEQLLAPSPSQGGAGELALLLLLLLNAEEEKAEEAWSSLLLPLGSSSSSSYYPPTCTLRRHTNTFVTDNKPPKYQPEYIFPALPYYWGPVCVFALVCKLGRFCGGSSRVGAGDLSKAGVGLPLTLPCHGARVESWQTLLNAGCAALCNLDHPTHLVGKQQRDILFRKGKRITFRHSWMAFFSAMLLLEPYWLKKSQRHCFGNIIHKIYEKTRGTGDSRDIVDNTEKDSGDKCLFVFWLFFLLYFCLLVFLPFYLLLG